MSIEQARVERVEAISRGRVRAFSSAWIAAASMSGFWIALILIIHRNSPRTLVSFHGLLHAAIAGQFLSPTSTLFPPENPFYAGQPVAYYWFFQYLAAQITRVFDINIFYSLEALVLLATGVLIGAAVFLGRKIYGSVATGILMGYLIMAGTNPLGWVQLLRSIVSGGTIVLNDSPSHLWGVVHPIYSLIRYNDVGGLYGPLFNFFLNITSRPVALAFLLLMLLFLRNSFHDQRLRPLSLLALGFTSALTTAFSPIVGIGSAVALFLALLAFSFLDGLSYKRGPSDTGASVQKKILLGLTVLAGAVVAAPTYYHLMTGPSANHLSLGLFSIDGIRHVVTSASSIFLLVILAIVGLMRSHQTERQFLGILTLTALGLCALDLVFSLPAGNTSNFFHAAVVLLAVPAAGSVIRRNGDPLLLVSRWRAVTIVIVFLPTLLLLLTSYINRPLLAASFDSHRVARLPADSDRSRLYQWVQNETDLNSVFVVDPRERVAMCGNTSELPAITGRSIFTEDYRHYIAEPYADSKLRFEIAVRLVSGTPYPQTDLGYLSKFNRPIYIIHDQSVEGSTPVDVLINVYGTPAFQYGTISVYRWRIAT